MNLNDQNEISFGQFLKSKYGHKLQSFRDRTFLTNKRLNEIVHTKLVEAASYEDDDEDQFRPISTDITRDLLPIKHSRHLDICYKLWLQNPLAQRMIRTTKNFVIGGGVEIQCDDSLKEKVIDPFWNDFKNNMDLKLPQKVEALSVFGEQIYPVFVGSAGSVRLGYVDPKAVSKVITNPDNIEEPVALKVRRKNDTYGTSLKIITIDENPVSPTKGYLTGDVFYFAINKMPNSKRGYSDLLASADWLDGYDQFLYNVVERSVFLNAFIWDVLVKNADEEKLKEMSRKQGQVKPGTTRFHNESTEWKAVTPDLKASDMADLFKMMRTQVIGSAGYPLHWFGDGSDANLATAHEMGYPTFKMLEERQKYIKFMLTMILQFVIDQSRINKTSLKEVHGDKAIKDYDFDIKFPELTTKDVGKTSTAFQAVANGLAVFSVNEWISDETAVKFLAHLASNFGIEIDVTTEYDNAKKSKEDQNNKDYQESDLEKIKTMLKKSNNGLDKQLLQLLNTGSEKEKQVA